MSLAQNVVYPGGFLRGFISVLYDFIFVLQHVAEPISYAVCNDESEPTLDVRFFAVQIASTNPDICDRTLFATADPAEYEPGERSELEYIFFPRRVSRIRNQVAISESV